MCSNQFGVFKKEQSPTRWQPFRKSGSGGKANRANENQDPYDQTYWGKGRGKKGKRGKSKFQYPYDGNKGYPSADNGKGKGGHDKGKSICSQPQQRIWRSSPPIKPAPSTKPTYVRPRLGSIMELYSSMRHPAQDKHSWRCMLFSSMRKRPSTRG